MKKNVFNSTAYLELCIFRIIQLKCKKCSLYVLLVLALVLIFCWLIINKNGFVPSQ
jgi:hypothetical protein